MSPHPVLAQYRLVRHADGGWSLIRAGVPRCAWTGPWPPAAILRIASQAVRSETGCRTGWRRVGFGGEAVHYRPFTPSADGHPERRARRPARRPGPRRSRPPG
ncbi:hypothetical protein [Actinoplanes nipponensis]|uniref:Uncharacterized protein n=1 Tax=Actinoplanes nipponensis TaxID=135950 RepID=A0A919MK82_9ACTN|nr:hypothetical protein [Actinoplanes nipponensis]GIE47452.1 hypothetical protein Ani05nite_09860 [Actinoplanes nipponensis]